MWFHFPSRVDILLQTRVGFLLDMQTPSIHLIIKHDKLHNAPGVIFNNPQTFIT